MLFLNPQWIAFEPFRRRLLWSSLVAALGALGFGDARAVATQDPSMVMQQFVALESLLDQKLRYHPDEAWAAPLNRRLQGCRSMDHVSRAGCIGDVFSRWLGRECGIAPDLRFTESRIAAFARQTEMPVEMVRGMAADDPLVSRLFAMSAVLWTEGCDRTRGDGADRSQGADPGNPSRLPEPSESLRRQIEEKRREMQPREGPLAPPPAPPKPNRSLEDELRDPVGVHRVENPCLSAEDIPPSKREALKALTLCLWGNHAAFGPSIRASIGRMSPRLGEYVMKVFVCHREAHRFMRLFGEAIDNPRPWNKWDDVAEWVVNMIQGYASKEQDWGLAIRASLSLHGQRVRDYLVNGTDDFGDPVIPLGYSCGRIGGD